MTTHEDELVPLVTDDELRDLEERFDAAYAANEYLVQALNQLKENNERLIEMNQKLLDENTQLKISLQIKELVSNV